MIQEEFTFYQPCKPLQPYVRYYWTFKSQRPLNTFTFPIGCTQIIFHKQTPLYIPELDKTQDKLTISGQVNFSSHVCANGGLETIVVVFHPHAMSLFLHMPTALFYNQEVSGYDLEDNGLNELATQVFEWDEETDCIRQIETWLLAQIANCRPEVLHRAQRVDATIRQLYRTPQTSVADLSSLACLSKKQFERWFQAMVGINPKEYARIVRFQKALVHLQHASVPLPLAQIAYASGYADQSHFIRECKKLCGYTPLSLLNVARPYSDLFTDPF